MHVLSVTKIRRVPVFCLAFILTCLVSLASWADDLEIYLGTGNQAVTYNPNVLFIMDTSGSMSGKDGTSQTRLLRVQNALNAALSSATNINAGLMRFSDYGGPILYPVRDIDSVVAPEIITPIAQGVDDAVEVNSTVNTSSTNLILVDGTDTQYTGLRYQKLNIPRNAIITKAYLRFTARVANTENAVIQIHAELSGSAADFSTSAISTRNLNTQPVIWDSDNIFANTGSVINSPDLSALVQEVVNQNTWCGGNDLALILLGTGSTASAQRQTYGFEQGTGAAPQLVIEYDDSTATGCTAGTFTYQVTDQSENAEERSNGRQSTGSELTFRSQSNDYIGVRFQNINLPQGATVINAYIEFTAYQTNSGSNARMTIQGVNQDDPDDFSPYIRYMLRDKPKTVAVQWENIGAWNRNNTYQTPALTGIVQQILNRSGWQPNNAMMFIFSNFSSAKRGAYTYNGKPSGAAKLIIEYQANAIPGSSSTVRELLQSKVDSLTHSGLTPIVDTLYEAVSYYGGRNVDYGLQRGPNGISSTVRRNTRVSHRLSYTGSDAVRPSGCTEDNLDASACVGEYIPTPATYISPVTDLQCQTNNHIVLLSDGAANNNHSVSKIQTLLGKTCSGSGGEKCGLDLVDNVSQSNSSAIGARVITHTIGFAANATANNFLNQLALRGGGGFYQADNSNELVDAFQQILRSVKDVNATFVSPGVAVNQLNRLTHKDELYFALFKPSEGAVWPGNLKKYKITGDTILDKNGANAVDTTTGFFSEFAHSYWSTPADGNDVRQGGAASKLSLARNVYYFSNTPGSIFKTSNRLSESNLGITTSDLALDTLPDPTGLRNLVLQWARGVDVRDDDGDGDNTDIRQQMGDPIHSQPVIVNYSATDSAILVATNHGMLHSFDAETGVENFAIMPQELMSNLYEFYQDGSSYNHIYGLDGDLVLRRVGDKTYLYVGMRRGGDNYYVFDISSKLDPKLVFTIDGGQGAFSKLGQTWSRPTITKMQIGTESKNVMIIGGGYDDSQDTKTVRSPDSVGNAIFIIDADTGAKLFEISASSADLIVSDMDYAIPGRISSIDRDNDGYVDHLYAADTGGQLFRFDIYNGQTGANLVKGQRIADFGGDTEATNRRFYYGPDISAISQDTQPFYAVAMGSGHRAHPLNTTIQDGFYMYRDEGVFKRDENGAFTFPSSTITPASLYDASAHLLTTGNELEKAAALTAFQGKQGWRIDLQAGGEKVLASPLILDYQVFFTTYVPASLSNSLCAPPSGNSRAYLVNLFNGNAVTDLNENTITESGDRYAQLSQTGIAPDTKILIENIVKPVVCLGAECVSAVIEYDNDGNEITCTGDFACLARNIYGRFERVQQQSWTTEIEKN